MSIFEKLADLVQSYFTDDKSGDALYEESLDELERFLRGGGDAPRFRSNERRGENSGERAQGDTERSKNMIPEDVRAAFSELGVPSPSDAETCKTAYKRLLKLHHPDRHAGHEGNMKKATEKSARINAAYGKICEWRKGAL